MKVIQNSSGTATAIEMCMPFDGHQHVRQGDMLNLVAPMVRKRFAQAIIMPNTTPPITTADAVDGYHRDIIAAMYPEWWDKDGKPVEARPPVPKLFDCLMTLYLTDTLSPKEVEEARLWGAVGVKYYPPGKKGVELTTNSSAGVSDPTSLWTKGTNTYEVLKTLARNDMACMLHAADGFARSTKKIGDRQYREGDELDPYDQEIHFIRETLPRTIDAHPDLKISVEHLSTKDGAAFMNYNGGEGLGCSLTLHHLTKDRRDVFRGGFHPHLMWWPIIQGHEHAEALRELAVADKPFVWLGSDSAPHPMNRKIAECCIGGVLTAHLGLEGYVEAFEDMNALDDRFERFASINGPRFYGREPSEKTIRLAREDWKVEHIFHTTDTTHRPTPDTMVVPFRLGETVRWKIAD
jgi:dihydroorotase